MKETVQQFGEENRLIGIVTEPIGKPQPINFVLLNSGLLAKAGAFRFSVDLARALAALDIRVLRFDFGGIGDSDTGYSSETFIERSNKEITLALDMLQTRYQSENFIIGGLCSAADCTLKIAPSDERIKGVLMIDAPAYPTLMFHMCYQRNRMLRLIQSKTWRNILHVFRKPQKTDENTSLDLRVFPPQQSMQETLQILLNRNAELFFCYTGGVMDYFNYKNQFRDMFPSLEFNDKLALHYLPYSDHLSILQYDREILIKLIVEWSQVKLITKK